MQFNMGVRERLVLLGALPAEGNLATIRVIGDLRMALSFSEAEHEDLQITQVDGQIQWNPDAPARAIEIGAKGQEIVRDALSKLDKDKKLTADHLDICDLFEYEGA